MKIMKPTIYKRNIGLTDLTTNKQDEEMRASGLAVVFNKPTVICEINGIEFKEEIDRNAFDEADISKCCLKYNHSDHVPILARVRSGNLNITIDSVGLKFEAKLFNTTVARDVYAILEEKGLDSCSFAFTIKEESYDSETHTRRILKIDKLFDISIVDFPAYEDTEVSARNFFQAEAEKIISLENEELKRKRTILKLKLAK